MHAFTRRRFLKSGVAASTALPLFTIAGTKASGRILGANETVRIGVAGINGRGKAHIKEFSSIENVQVTYLIDPDSRLYESRGKALKEKFGSAPRCVPDIRTALDDDQLDAVSVATCNHWHSLITIWACQAMKDVYVEKPISHNVFEGRQCVEAMRRYGRIVQHGTQQRSSAGRANEIDAVQSGKYGKLLVSKAYCCKPRWSIGTKSVQAPPDGFDFNLWLGPAPKQPFHGNLHPYNWHWFWDFGNGDIGNQGVHEMDVARWAIPNATLPQKVWSLGGRFMPGDLDQGETPNMLLSVYDFGGPLIVFETRGLVAKNGAPPFKVANEYYTSEGVIRGGKFYASGSDKGEPVAGGNGTVNPGGPFPSFINAVRERDISKCNCDAEVAHYSAALCHLGNISYRLGEPVPFSNRPGSLGKNTEVASSFEMLQENLNVVGISLDETTYQMGRTLTVDAKAEKFVGDDQANSLLRRDYRVPFVVPDRV